MSFAKFLKDCHLKYLYVLLLACGYRLHIPLLFSYVMSFYVKLADNAIAGDV